MRLSRGDVILCKGSFALAWDVPASNFLRIFPITDFEDGYSDDDVLIPAWQDFYQVSRISGCAIRITAGRIVAPFGWLNLAPLALSGSDIRNIAGAITALTHRVGVQHEWPYSGSDAVDKAPIFAS